MKKTYTQEDFLQTVDALKKIHLWGFKGYNTASFLYRSVLDYMLLGVRRQFHWKEFIKALVFRWSEYKLPATGHQSIFLKSKKYAWRKDMLDIYDKVSSVSSDIGLLEEIEYGKIDLTTVLRSIYIFQWIYQFRKAKIPKNLIIAFVYDAIKGLQFLHFLSSNADKLNEAKAFIVLNDEYSDENLFIQYGNKLGVSTATLQHGIYARTIDDNDLRHFMHIFPNLTADKIFMWGEQQKEIAIHSGVNPEKIVVTGHPRYIHASKVRKLHNKIIGVCLDGYTERFWKSNIQIINICNRFCKEFDYKYIVKIHPTDNEKRYQEYYDCDYYIGIADRNQAVSDFASKVELSVVGFSSIYYELMFLGISVFRYDDHCEFNTYEGVDDFNFETYDQLADIYEEMNSRPLEYNDKYYKVRRYLCGEEDVYNNYKNAIEDLCKNKTRIG